MKSLVIAVLVLAFAIPAVAGQNPDVAIYLYSTSTGVGGTNHRPSPAPGMDASVYVCFDHFGPGGVLWGATWRFLEVPGPDFVAVTNLYAGGGGGTIGTPTAATGVVMSVGHAAAYPDANGIVVLARVDYEMPEGMARGGKITIIRPITVDGGVVVDANNDMDDWCVHSTSGDGLSGNWYWDSGVADEGDCEGTSQVQSRIWGSIKALYR
jgi:hypothetical protein